jgi:hypothetical protein
VAKAAVTFDDLSPVSNARRAGYVVADQAFVEVGPVTKVTYTDQKRQAADGLGIGAGEAAPRLHLRRQSGSSPGRQGCAGHRQRPAAESRA